MASKNSIQSEYEKGLACGESSGVHGFFNYATWTISRAGAAPHPDCPDFEGVIGNYTPEPIN